MNELQELTEFLKLLSAETERKFRELTAETERRAQETERRFQETDRMITELARERHKASQETDRELKETGRLVKELSRNIQGISDSNGKVAEQFFYSSLAATLSLNGQAFVSFTRNSDRKIKTEKGLIGDEFDVILLRPDAAALVEIKYRLRRDDVENLATKKVKNFRMLFPEESAGKVIYLAAAGLSVDSGALHRAKELGIYVLTQRGEAIELLNDDVKEY